MEPSVTPSRHLAEEPRSIPSLGGSAVMRERERRSGGARARENSS